MKKIALLLVLLMSVSLLVGCNPVKMVQDTLLQKNPEPTEVITDDYDDYDDDEE